ncbi:site-specific integrase [Desulforhabdus sp. TSK]|uniref:tyrosine-type recombinase/integrase n=1 Tax=Desulforhabdus sp. TSK TaxID=2925014 RepID=UPI001FC830ED|nr:site-specific integrase [Desulforhabdus sp. TSK]GKT10641.1 hypothetical protein DSTSK_39460 [Desulforhabdus sp. TSK]
MSVYSVKGRGWRYDFTLRGERHTEAWFKTKKEAVQAEAKRRQELENPKPVEQQMTLQTVTEIPIGISFLELVNRRLDFVKAYKSEEHYKTNVYLARRWVRRWGEMGCRAITSDMIQQFLIERRRVSPYTANKDLRHLRATFNYGKKKKIIDDNPSDGIEFFPVERKIKHVPRAEEIEKVISFAEPDTQDYLRTINDTMARVGEINRLTWDDVNLEERYIVLYTRKKRGGHLTPRKVPMTQRLYEILKRRQSSRDKSHPWVFCNRYVDQKTGKQIVGQFQYRKTIIKTLCKKAGVENFTYHALRHSGASIMDNNSVPIGAIQKILGHENRTTTEIYLHSIGRTEQEAISVFERATQNSHTDSHTAEKTMGHPHTAHLN